jgi:hypothetical protein
LPPALRKLKTPYFMPRHFEHAIMLDMELQRD